MANVFTSVEAELQAFTNIKPKQDGSNDYLINLFDAAKAFDKKTFKKLSSSAQDWVNTAIAFVDAGKDIPEIDKPIDEEEIAEVEAKSIPKVTASFFLKDTMLKYPDVKHDALVKMLHTAGYDMKHSTVYSYWSDMRHTIKVLRAAEILKD